MGKLLLFAKGKHPAQEQTERAKDAELVLFTGVRYERQQPDDELPPDTKPQRNSGG